MSINDNGIRFERIVNHFFNHPPENTEKYANIYSDRKAAYCILYSICVKESISNYSRYAKSDLDKFENYQRKILNFNFFEKSNEILLLLEVIEFLEELMHKK